MTVPRFTPTQVLEIRALHSAGAYSIGNLAARYETTYTTMRKLVIGQSYGYLDHHAAGPCGCAACRTHRLSDSNVELARATLLSARCVTCGREEPHPVSEVLTHRGLLVCDRCAGPKDVGR